MRIDAEQYAGSRMSYYTALSLVAMGPETSIPAPPEQQLQVTGIPAGLWINFVTWAKDGKSIAFTTRSAGGGGGTGRGFSMSCR